MIAYNEKDFRGISADFCRNSVAIFLVVRYHGCESMNYISVSVCFATNNICICRIEIANLPVVGYINTMTHTVAYMQEYHGINKCFVSSLIYKTGEQFEYAIS